MLKLLKRLDNSITGDIIGVVCMTIIFIAGPWIALALH
jgi:cbb3-type cytochrome oxidase subunit 3